MLLIILCILLHFCHFIAKFYLFQYTNTNSLTTYTEEKTMGIRKFDVEIGHVQQNTAKLLSITTSKFEGDWISAPHTHYYTEIFYIKSGKGHMQIENSLVSLNPDMLIIINAHVQHTEISSPIDPLDYYVIGAEGLQITNETNPDYTVIQNSGRHHSIRQCFENILDEMHSKQEGYLEICQNYLEILVRKICRKQCVTYDISDSKSGNRECHKAKQYIEANYPEKITLDGLAKISNINKYYLSHRFTEIYGKSPISYLNQVRINACKDLLKNTNHTIEEIAASTGFSSRSYLAQVFQKSCGMTCQQYRKAYRE